MQLNVNAIIPYIIKASLKLQAKDNLWMDTVSFIVTASPSCYALVMKENGNPVKLIGMKDRIGIVKT